MIKVRKQPKRYGEMVKVSKEACTDTIFLKRVLSDLKLKRPPKNTLKIVPIKTECGYHGEDFVYNLITFAITFHVYTFRR